MSLRAEVAPRASIALDARVVIAHFNAEDAHHDAANAIVTAG